MSIDLKWYNNQIEIYRDSFPLYERFSHILKEKIQNAVQDFGLMAIIQSRPKSITSFAEKIIRKRHKYKMPVFQLTDLCGVRVITERKDQLTPYASILSSILRLTRRTALFLKNV